MLKRLLVIIIFCSFTQDLFSMKRQREEGISCISLKQRKVDLHNLLDEDRLSVKFLENNNNYDINQTDSKGNFFIIRALYKLDGIIDGRNRSIEILRSFPEMTQGQKIDVLGYIKSENEEIKELYKIIVTIANHREFDPDNCIVDDDENYIPHYLASRALIYSCSTDIAERRRKSYEENHLRCEEEDKLEQDMLRNILLRCNKILNKYNLQGKTPLYLLSERFGCPHIAQTMMSECYKKESKDPLLDLVNIFLDCGASVQIQARASIQTPLGCAIQYKDPWMFILLASLDSAKLSNRKRWMILDDSNIFTKYILNGINWKLINDKLFELIVNNKNSGDKKTKAECVLEVVPYIRQEFYADLYNYHFHLRK